MPRGIPNKSKPGPRSKWKQDPERIKVILDEIETTGDIKTACELAMIHPATLNAWMKDDEILLMKVNLAKAKAIRALQHEVRDQKASWKILKNIGKDRYKELVENEVTLKQITTLDPGDGSSDDFKGY